MNLMMLLEMAGAGFGDRVAVQCEGEALTYAELFGAAGAAAAEIAATGAENAAVLDVSSRGFASIRQESAPFCPSMAVGGPSAASLQGSYLPDGTFVTSTAPRSIASK